VTCVLQVFTGKVPIWAWRWRHHRQRLDSAACT